MSTYTNLYFHIVFSTKYRKPMILPEWEDRLHSYIGGIIRNENGTAVQIGGMPDHVHLLVQTSPSIAIADLVRTIKSNSTRWVNQRISQKPKFYWQSSYAAFSVSYSQLDSVNHYISNQKHHHKSRNYENEIEVMLKRNNIEYDKNYLFENEPEKWLISVGRKNENSGGHTF